MYKVGVTGITGYLGSAVGKALLEKGNYFVRGSVRSLRNERKIDPIKKAYEGQEANYELVEADLLNPDSIQAFSKDLDFFIHVASPFPNLMAKLNPEEIMKPAIDGTKNVFKAAKDSGIKRVV
jgi:dihydroflavonol-4-reductase